MSTSIEWTDETWNCVVGCSKVSPGCEHCYAINVAHRGMSPQHRGLTVVTEHKKLNWNGEVRPVPSVLAKPLGWKKPRRVFVNSMSDLFHERLVDTEEGCRYIAAVFGVMAACQHITFQILTKRPESARKWFAWLELQADRQLWGFDVAGPASVCLGAAIDVLSAEEDSGSNTPKARDRMRTKQSYGEVAWPLPNVHLGVTAEDQPRADERIPVLLELPAAVRFVSVEPMLGPVSLSRWLETTPVAAATIGRPDQPLHEPLDWVICGGESGNGARPMHRMWPSWLQNECRSNRVPFMFKQWGEYDATGNRVGKKAAGRELDGRTHDEFPQSAAREKWKSVEEFA